MKEGWLRCVHVCAVVPCVYNMRGWGAFAAREEVEARGEQGARLCCGDGQAEMAVAPVWALLPPRANVNLHVLPSVHLSVCLSICILN